MGTPTVPTAKLSAPAFGKWLATQRGARSYEEFAIKVRNHVDDRAGLKVDRSLIKKYEAGRIPQWPVLSAYIRISGTSPADVLLRLLTAIEFADGHSVFTGLAPVPDTPTNHVERSEARFGYRLSKLRDPKEREAVEELLKMYERRERAAERRGRK